MEVVSSSVAEEDTSSRQRSRLTSPGRRCPAGRRSVLGGSLPRLPLIAAKLFELERLESLPARLLLEVPTSAAVLSFAPQQVRPQPRDLLTIACDSHARVSALQLRPCRLARRSVVLCIPVAHSSSIESTSSRADIRTQAHAHYHSPSTDASAPAATSSLLHLQFLPRRL